MLFQFSVKTSLVVNYLSNIADISNTCINKQKPELQCFGKCVLVKWIKEVEKHESKQQTLKPFFETQILFCSSISIPAILNYTVITYSIVQQKPTLQGYVSKLEHPPTLLNSLFLC